ncbi:MAG: glutamyl-tRNA reductase [Actinomycetota bacterium]|jgi:glutamyl-tRNA reductase
MSLLALGVSHRTATLEELERISVPAPAMAEALPCLLRAPDVVETVVLSTCNRTEIYAWVRDPDAATDQIRLFLEDLKDLPASWLRGRMRVMLGDEAIRHLFAVTAGLDSMVIGEAEIQGQVRTAYRTASGLGGVGPHLHGLFRWALESGKRARTVSGLKRARESFPRAAVRAIELALGGLENAEVLVVGNGTMAQASLRALGGSGARVGVTARRAEAAEALASAYDGFALPLHALEDALVTADAAIFATSATDPILDAPELATVVTERDGRPLTLVDLGLPRNVDAGAAALPSVRLFDLTRLDADGFTTALGHAEQLAAATDVVTAEAARCVAWFRSRPADAVVAAIQAHAERVAEREARAAALRIPGLDERQRAAVEKAIRQSVRRVVHTPTVRAKEACARGDEDALQVARWLFGIDSLEGATDGTSAAAERQPSHPRPLEAEA